MAVVKSRPRQPHLAITRTHARTHTNTQIIDSAVNQAQLETETCRHVPLPCSDAQRETRV